MTNCYEDSTGIWRNRGFRTLYTQMTESCEAAPKLLKLLDKYGIAFDDDWQYRYFVGSKYIERRPLWMNPAEGGWLTQHTHNRVKSLKPRLTGNLAEYLKDKEGEG